MPSRIPTTSKQAQADVSEREVRGGGAAPSHWACLPGRPLADVGDTRRRQLEELDRRQRAAHERLELAVEPGDVAGQPVELRGALAPVRRLRTTIGP
jgi:hypothetical protein